jgi:hypothetical protein
VRLFMIWPSDTLQILIFLSALPLIIIELSMEYATDVTYYNYCNKYNIIEKQFNKFANEF